jgi:hypothetical protein
VRLSLAVLIATPGPAIAARYSAAVRIAGPHGAERCSPRDVAGVGFSCNLN